MDWLDEAWQKMVYVRDVAWHFATTNPLVRQAAWFVFKTTVHVAEMAPAAVNATYALATDKETQTIVRQVGTIVWEDVLPVAALALAKHSLGGWLDTLEKEHDIDSDLLEPLAWAFSTNAALFSYLLTKRFTFRTAILSMLAFKKLTQARLPEWLEHAPLDLCGLAHQGGGKELVNQFSETLNWALIDFAIQYAPDWNLGFLTLSEFLGYSNTTRYVLRLILAERGCVEHRDQFLQCYPELVLAFALALPYATHLMCDQMGFLGKDIRPFVEVFVLMAFITMGTFYRFPAAKPNAPQGIDYHPIGILERILGYFTRLVIKHPPSLPMGKGNVLAVISESMRRLGQAFPVLAAVRKQTVKNGVALVQHDNVVGPYFEELRKASLMFLEGVEKAQQSKIVQNVTYYSTPTAQVLKTTHHVPKRITFAVCATLNNTVLMGLFHEFWLVLIELDPNRVTISSCPARLYQETQVQSTSLTSQSLTPDQQVQAKDALNPEFKEPSSLLSQNLFAPKGSPLPENVFEKNEGKEQSPPNVFG